MLLPLEDEETDTQTEGVSSSKEVANKSTSKFHQRISDLLMANKVNILSVKTLTDEWP